MKFDNILILVTFIGLVASSGLIAGLILYDLNLLETALQQVNFTLPIEELSQANANLTSFQDILDITIYPLLGLKNSLPYLTYFMIFGLIGALAISAYLSSKNPVFFVVHLLVTLIVTYLCFIISNQYIVLLEDPFINSLMVDFVIYNKVMFFLPQIVFFTSLLFGIISFISLIKPQSASLTGSLNYGGDY